MLPAKADPEKQKEFLEQEIQPRIDEAQARKRVVFFVDAAHFVLSAFLGFLWSATRIFIPAPSGRQRFNVLGALNAITHELVTITNDTYITAQSVCALLEKIANFYVGLPITIFLDNARYQRCALVMETAKRLNIELCFLPSYSPNLNLIEERPTEYPRKTYQPQSNPGNPSLPSYGGTDGRTISNLPTEGQTTRMGYLPPGW
jgi:DDE superfamily endonuclease